MTLSINTNNSALAALQTLNATQSELTQTENRVSSGLAVGSAADNPAVYAISQTMNSQISALSGVSNGLSFAGQAITTGINQASSISSVLSTLSATITQAQTSGYNQDTMNASITQALKQIDAAASSATFQTVNLLAGSTGNGVDYTSVSTAQDINGTLYTQQGYNATSSGLGLTGLNVNQAGVSVAFADATKTLGAAAAGDTITVNNTQWGSGATATAGGGTATDPAVQYQYVADNYTSTGKMAAAQATSITTAVTTALGSSYAGSALTVAADGTITAATATDITNKQTSSDGTTTYSLTGGDTITASKDASGNYSFTVSSAFDTNGNATQQTVIKDVNLGATTASATDKASALMGAMSNSGFSVTQDSATGALTIAGNNIDTSATSSVTLSLAGASASSVSDISGSQVALAAVQAAITKMNSISSSLGAGSQQITQLASTVSSLSSSLTTGVGALTDADMAAESAKLTSLQTKQQLAIQALSIANTQSQSILSLFR
ncbi:flagellin B [Ameyamaea chiangmaiensis NBRC 103196]|uniref:Flagellin n=1 Tax=Ameyamaea chiangmaiensis TaxID=442969 RepID=A0A850PDK6_9PROT|nr:flagellin [Ameyamaea chiangmaiensis]MBS4075093.1 flagellin B [Ameyamaea chiangmaiensis]NVN40560.1 flagellin B [Ameyamaea chiangmaiensis]GBQ65493.1 flagellin B [Ameyamaea chiangmaiensis NBRC 103196]